MNNKITALPNIDDLLSNHIATFNDKKNVISLGAGVQSSTLALMAAVGEITPMPDLAIFADTQAEPQSVYRWLDWLEGQLPFPIVRVTAGSLTEDSLKIKNGKIRTFIPLYTLNQKGSGMLWRKCTTEYKIKPIHKELRQFKSNGVIQWMGISTDEAHRQKDSRVKWIEHRYPLIEKGMSRTDCLRWMEEHHYPTPPKSACSYCPFHSDMEWNRLKTLEPQEFQKAVEFEKALQYQQTQQTTLESIPFLHPTCKPLDTVQFRHQDQRNLWGNECEGFCGI